MPALTPEAAARQRAAGPSLFYFYSPPESHEDLSFTDRCLARGMPGAMTPGYGYNHNYQILQTPDYVVISIELIHDVRLIPLDGRPHPSQRIRHWLGDSRGHWDGDTLVVDLIHFNDQTWFDRAGNLHSEDLHVVERYTRSGPDHLTYDVTIEDPTVFTRPWKMSMPIYRRQEEDIRLLEYECYAYVQSEVQ